MKFTLTVLFVLTTSAIGLGCERDSAPEAPESKSESPAEPAKKQADEPPEQKTEAPEDGAWTVVEAEALEEPAAEKLGRAKEAQKALGKTLIGALSTSVSDKGFAESVSFCHEEAPEIAAEVSEKHEVAIGRTSFKLRNPENAPPEWARPLIEERVDQPRVLRGPDGKVGWFAPIRLAEMCVNCHGTQEQLADGVPEMLSTHYPEDEATGFEPGDLRGWFWVEVPGS